MNRKNGIYALIISGVCIMLLFCACGTKRNTTISRNWQAFTTRYNVYFNGKEHYDETLNTMLRTYEDDYSRLLPVDPAEARNDETLPQPAGDFTRTIEKMQKAIQLHSITRKPARRSASTKDREFRNRSEFNPFLHNAWMMMAKSQYYNGDFLGAATTFLYISKHFRWLPATVTEARLWEAICYCALGWNYEAENAMRPVKEKDLSDNNLLMLYDRVNTELNIIRKDYSAAAEYLVKTINGTSGYRKKRLYFLLGQLYSSLGRKQEAYEAFRMAGKGETIPYRAKFNARIRQSEVYPGSDVKSEIRSLRAMTRYERNNEYLDQIYYAMGNLSLASKDTASAMKYYALAIEKSTRQGIDKALAQVAQGNVYFQREEYVKAQVCYSEAIPLLPETYPGLSELRKRSDVLDRLSLYAGNVELQDSLLKLAAMPEAERLKICEGLAGRYVAEQKKALEKSRQEEFEKNKTDVITPMARDAANAASNQIPDNDNSWYFYNRQTVATGKAEFLRKWGARKLEDNWRRRNKASFALDENESTSANTEQDNDEAETKEENQKGGNGKKIDADTDKPSGPEDASYYMAQIPLSDQEKENANDIIQEGLYNMGLILKDELEDFPAARREFLKLDSRYHDNIYRLDVYYNLYIMAIVRGERSEAEKWRRKIIDEFPMSAYGQAMRDPEYFENLKRMAADEENLYEKAYDAYLAGNTTEVHSIMTDVEKRYPLTKLMPKFVFLDALSYLSEGEDAPYRERLDTLLLRWPDTEMTPIAAGIVSGLKAGRKPNSDGQGMRAMIWKTRLTNDSIEQNKVEDKAKFVDEPEKPQYLVLVFPKDSVNTNRLLYDVARFNFSSFVIKDFDIEPMNFGDVGMLVIKGFDNLRELEYYRRRMSESDFMLPQYVRPVVISKSNFRLLLKEGRSFEDYFRYQENPSTPHGLPEPESPENVSTE